MNLFLLILALVFYILFLIVLFSLLGSDIKTKVGPVWSIIIYWFCYEFFYALAKIEEKKITCPQNIKDVNNSLEKYYNEVLTRYNDIINKIDDTSVISEEGRRKKLKYMVIGRFISMLDNIETKPILYKFVEFANKQDIMINFVPSNAVGANIVYNVNEK